LDVQQCSHECTIGEAAFQQVTQPIIVAGQRASGLPFGAPRVQALCSALVVFCLLPHGFTNRDLRRYLAPLLGLDPSHLTAGRMTYELRRLRLHGLIERVPGTQRYRVTPAGLRIALFFTRTYARVLRPGLAHILAAAPPGDDTLRPHFDDLEAALARWVEQAKLAA
jgi:hypothetical protein